MTALLILLYVLRANGIVIPDGCLFVAWIAWISKLFIALDNFTQKGGGNGTS